MALLSLSFLKTDHEKREKTFFDFVFVLGPKVYHIKHLQNTVGLVYIYKNICYTQKFIIPKS